ncbi:MAG: DUF262 domain-containing protein [Clostridia bacterium]|nr:DUF262 domain-containing protein [Clostridia bacterium]
MKTIIDFSVVASVVRSIISEIRTMEFRGLDLRPRYQRNYIWKNDFKDKLIYSIIKGYPIGNIIVRKLKVPNEKGAMSEIVDGQQRLTTIYEFIEGRYTVHSEISKDIIEAIKDFHGDRTNDELEKLKKRLNNKGKISIKFSELPPVTKEKFENFNISVTQISEADDSDITEYFTFLQNQERLRAGEILNSLADSKMDKYLHKIETPEEFCNIIGFDNIRKEFDKIFYNIIGLLDNKISFGVPDSIINKYVTTIDTLDEGEEKAERVISQTNKIIEEYKDTKIVEHTKKRFVKFLMLLMGFGFVDFTENTEYKLKVLEKIDNKLSVFFSTKPGIVEKEFEGYSSQIMEEFRAIALISKGAQTLERVKNRMEILAYYVENIDEKQKPSGISLE